MLEVAVRGGRSAGSNSGASAPREFLLRTRLRISLQLFFILSLVAYAVIVGGGMPSGWVVLLSASVAVAAFAATFLALDSWIEARSLPQRLPSARMQTKADGSISVDADGVTAEELERIVRAARFARPRTFPKAVEDAHGVRWYGPAPTEVQRTMVGRLQAATADADTGWNLRGACAITSALTLTGNLAPPPGGASPSVWAYSLVAPADDGVANAYEADGLGAQVATAVGEIRRTTYDEDDPKKVRDVSLFFKVSFESPP